MSDDFWSLKADSSFTMPPLPDPTGWLDEAEPCECAHPRQCHDALHYETERARLLEGRCAHHREEPGCYGRALPACYVAPVGKERCHAWTWELGEQVQCVRGEGHDEMHADGCIEWVARPIARTR